MTVRTTPLRKAFDHRMTAPGTDEAFLAAALPFLAEGLAAADEPPPVAIAAPAKLDALRDALGADAKAITLVPHTDWYTGSAANAVARAAGHLAAHMRPRRPYPPPHGTRVERPGRPLRARERRVAPLRGPRQPPVRPHLHHRPVRLRHPHHRPRPRHRGPPRPPRQRRVRGPAPAGGRTGRHPLPRPPADARRLPAPTTDAVRSWAAGHGLGAADAELFAKAVTEAASLAPVTTTLLWGEAPACVCELRLSHRVDDPLAGFVPPPATTPPPGQGLWFTRQVCAYVDLRRTPDGTAVRLQYG